MARNLSRDAILYILPAGTDLATASPSNAWEIKMLDGFSHNMDANTTEIMVKEAGLKPVRGKKIFTTSLNPASWSFKTYIKMFLADAAGTTRPQAVEGILWNAFISNKLGTVPASGGGDVTDSGVTTTADTITYDFAASDVHELLKLDLYFHYKNNTYKLSNAQVNTCTIDFNIDDIATVEWGGEGTFLEEIPAADHTTIANWVAGTNYYPSPNDVLSGCIKNRFTTMRIIDKNVGSPTENKVFTIPITGGSVTLENGITYLTPEELGVVNKACESITGARSLGGSVTAYLNTTDTQDGLSEATGFPTGELLKTMTSLTDATNTSFDVLIRVGGGDTYVPRVDLHFPTAHLVIPTVNTEDIISTEIQFTGQGSTRLEDTDELTVTYNIDVNDVYTE